MIDQDTLLRYAGHMRIAHHIAGRVRLKLAGDLAALGPEALKAAGRLNAALNGAPGIRSVSLNPLARSCTVEYDPTLIPAAAWEDLLGGVRSAAAGVLVDALLAAGRGAAER